MPALQAAALALVVLHAYSWPHAVPHEVPVLFGVSQPSSAPLTGVMQSRWPDWQVGVHVPEVQLLVATLLFEQTLTLLQSLPQLSTLSPLVSQPSSAVPTAGVLQSR